ncbi:MAG: hypothetical protein ACI9R3_005823 [Verrucomicrobiales bacterium]
MLSHEIQLLLKDELPHIDLTSRAINMCEESNDDCHFRELVGRSLSLGTRKVLHCSDTRDSLTCGVIFRESARWRILGAMFGAWSCGVVSAVEDPAAAFFEKEIVPVLERRCYECHSHESGKAKSGLVLDTRSGWEHGGDSGPALIPGNPNESLIIAAVRYGNVDTQMPPKGKLPEGEIALLEKWVAMGAPDPRQSEVSAEKTSVDIEAGRKHWAYQPIRESASPAVKEGQWPLTASDTFLLARLEGEGIRPAAETDRYTWLRRVSLDLTGLPAIPEEVAAFIADDSEDAFARVADRLLGSRAFGERWARHWLDLTGYADQVGTANNVMATDGWRYRDYLVDAFNADKPFDRFVREQIAGDLIREGTVEERAAALIATGFLLLGDIDIANSNKDQMRVDVTDQQVSKVGTAFLGMTLGCARCHDHKFDPIPVEDYYAIAGIFQSTDSTYKIDRGVWSMVKTVDLPETKAQMAERAALAKQHEEQLIAWKQERDLARKNKQDAEVRGLNRRIEHAEYFKPATPQAIAVSDDAAPSDMRITIRGNAHALGKVVPRGFLQVASSTPAKPIPNDRSGRLELADWIVSPENPLTARVTVNRLWQKFFGEGLVRSVDYFGLRGETPSHPELLDHLANRFVSSGWSQKKLIRDLVLSRAYRMGGHHDSRAAALDPDNRLLWRMNPQRLDAESMRDSLFAVSGVLQTSNGGPALALEYPENVNGLDPKNVNPPGFSLTTYRPGQKRQRTLYLPIIRSGAQPAPAELRNLFDFTQPAIMSGQRPITAVPTQALFLMNSDELKQRAAELASRTVSETSKPAERISQLWLLTYGRPISEEETSDTLRFLESLPQDESAWVDLCHALLASNEFLMRL